MSERDAWAAYWRGAPGRGCLSDAPPSIARLLQDGWRGFAAGLPHDARLLDLATGTGAVLQIMIQARPDLDLVGVDYAAPSVRRDRVSVMGGIDCTSLPFDDASFDAVTSQFGVEYCGDRAIGEAVRVLRPGAPLRFVVHHADGPAVRHNAARAAALGALRDAGLFALGRRLAAGLPTDPKLEAAIAGAQRQHASQSVAAELPAAVGQALRSAQPGQHIADLERRAGAEVERIFAMQAAALGEPEVRELTGRLEQAGATATADILGASGEKPVAWIVSGNKR